MIGNGLAAVIDVLYNSFGAFGAFVFAALLQPLVVTRNTSGDSGN